MQPEDRKETLKTNAKINFNQGVITFLIPKTVAARGNCGNIKGEPAVLTFSNYFSLFSQELGESPQQPAAISELCD